MMVVKIFLVANNLMAVVALASGLSEASWSWVSAVFVLPLTLLAILGIARGLYIGSATSMLARLPEAERGKHRCPACKKNSMYFYEERRFQRCLKCLGNHTTLVLLGGLLSGLAALIVWAVAG